MFTRRALSLILAILWLWPGTAHGLSPAFIDAYNRTLELFAQGRYNEALPFLEEAVRLSPQEFGPDHPVTSNLLNNLARAYHGQGRYTEAEPLYKRLLAIREKVLGPDHLRVAETLENYAALLRETGRSAEAAELEARAKAIRAKYE